MIARRLVPSRLLAPALLALCTGVPGPLARAQEASPSTAPTAARHLVDHGLLESLLVPGRSVQALRAAVEHMNHHAADSASHLPAPSHPEVRPNVSARDVLSVEEVPDERLSGFEKLPKITHLYEMAREIPHILDGLYCYCDCKDYKGHRSLLSCFEADGMSIDCPACLVETLMAYKLYEKGAELEHIRAAIDLQFEYGVDIWELVAEL